MELVDLHVHSTFSDGTFTPAQLVLLAVSKGLKAIALTDHDTVDGIREALEAAEKTELTVIPGTELSCLYQKKEIHILGLFIDHENVLLQDALCAQRKIRERRNIEMLHRFAEDGMVFTEDDLRNGERDTVITRAHFARVLVSKGYVATTEQAFRRYLDHGKKYCPQKEAFEPREAIRLILLAGGVPVVAHPMMYKLGEQKTEAMIVELKTFGLMGVEVYYSSHRQYESIRLQELCRKYSLLPTGGSDFHGSNKPDIDLGCGRGGLRVPMGLLTDINKQNQCFKDRELRRRESLL